MKKLGLTLVAAVAFSASVFANGNQTTNTEKWNGSINKTQLSKYLKLSSDQSEEVAAICDHFEYEMKRANSAKNGQDEKIRKAVYGNLKLMKNTLDEKQYSNYLKLMGMTLRNKGIDIEKK